MNKLRKFGFLVLAVICALFVFTSCRKDKGPTAEEAAARISTTVDKTVVTKDFVVNNSIVLEGVTFTVTWESNNAVAKVGTEKVGSNGEAKENGGFYLVSIGYETNTADQNVTLTATVANGKDTAQKSISFTVPKFATATFAEYAAADKETSLTVDGIVTGILSKTKGDQDNALFLNALDNTGGFYIYKLEKDPVTEGIKEGMTVRASGQKDLYSGTYEIVDPSVRIIDETIKTVAPVDLTEAYKAAADLKDAALVGPQALLVTIKGVTITTAAEDNGYYKFKLGDKESYIRISSSNCPLNVEETKKFKEDFAAHTGYLANATGVVSVYNGAFYLQPVSVNAFEYLSLPELSDAEQVAYEKESLTISATKFAADSTINLALKGSAYKDVAISWASNSEQVVIGTDGKATVTLGSKSATVKLTATLTKGEVTDTKEFTLELSSVGGIEIVDPEDGKTYYFGFYQPEKGEYLFINGETVPKNPWYHKTTSVAADAIQVTVKAVEGGYQLSFLLNNETNYFKAYKDGTHYSLVATTVAADATAFVYDTERQVFTFTIEGQLCYVACQSGKDTVSSNLDKYLDSMYFAHLYEIEDPENFGKEELPTTILTVTQALAATKGETIIVTGTIKEIQNEEYGNIVITDGTSDILIYGINDETGKKYGDWDASLKTLAVGQTITLIGERNEYNTTQQVKSCKIYVPTGDEPTEDKPSETPTYTEMTTAAAAAAEKGTYVKVSGTVVAENTQGFIIKDSAGLLNIYVKSSYDKSLAIGDIVTVQGKMDAYKGSPQVIDVTFTKTGTETVTQPTATDITANFAEFATANETVAPTQIIKFTGKYSVSTSDDKTYHNVIIEGVTTHQGSLYNPIDDFSALNEKTVEVVAYFLYVTGSTTKYVTVVVVSMTEVEVHEHTAATAWLKDATHHWHACATCQEAVQLDKAEHVWTEGTVQTPATETTDGLRIDNCTCGATKEVTIPMLSHTHTAGAEWKKDENKHWKECACGQDATKYEETDHTYGEPETTAATILAAGKKVYTCTVCGYVKEEAIAQLVSTVAEFLEAKDADNARVLQGYITAVAKIGEPGSFVLTDAAGTSVFCYTSVNVTLGDEILISAKYSVNDGFEQIGSPDVLKTVSTGNDVATKSGTAETVIAADVLTLLTASGTTGAVMYETYGAKYLAVRGYIIKSGNFYNLAVSQGGTKAVNMFTNKNIDVSGLVDKEVIVYGFARGSKITETDKYLTVQVQSVVEYVMSDAEKVAAAKEALTIEGDLTAVVDDLNLDLTGLNGATITWASSNTAAMTNDGVITRGAEDVTVVLTATIVVGEVELTKEFTVVVKALPQDEDMIALEAALSAFSYANKTVTEDFDLPATIEGHEGVAVTWEVTEGTAIVITEGKAVVTRPEFSLGNATVKLVATLTKNGKTVKAEAVTITVAALNELTVAQVFAQAASTTQTYVVKGTVAAINKTGFMLNDGTETIYVYYTTLTGLAIGDDVTVEGTRKDYSPSSNAYTIKQISATSVVKAETSTSTINANPVVLSADDLADYNTPILKPTLVSAKVLVVKSGDYYNLYFMDLDSLTLSEKSISIYSASTAQTSVLSSSVGKVVDLTGYVTYMTSSKYLYITAAELEVAELNDTEKVAYDKYSTTIESSVSEDFDLPLVGTHGSTIEWSIKEGTAITNIDATTGKATVKRDSEDATVILNATFSAGTEPVVQETKEFKVTVLAEGTVEPVLAATISFEEKANRVSQDTSSQVWSQNGITVTNTKGASTSNVADYANPARFYKSSNLNITYGTPMVKLVIKSTTDAKYQAVGTTMTGATVTIGEYITVVFDTPVTSFDFIKLTAQARYYSIEVYC